MARDRIVGKAIQSAACQLIRDVTQDPDYAATVDSVADFRTHSILCVPLIVNNQCIGALELLNKKGCTLFDEQDRHLSVVLVSSAALAINNAKMADPLVERERMRKELELAA